MPRSHFKTTLATIALPMWLIIQKKVPFNTALAGCDIRILLANESASNAERFLSAIESLFDSRTMLRALFPDLIPLPNQRKRWNQQEMLVNRNASWPEATIQTIGVGGAVQSSHFDVLILDDLIGKEAMESELVMEKTKLWLDYTESLLVNPSKSLVIVIGTRWHKRDIYQHIIDTDHRFEVYSRQAVEDGKPIFPERFTLEFFEDLKKKNLSMYLSQYLNNPTDPERCEFREQWIRYCSWNSDKVDYGDGSPPVSLSDFDIVGAFDPSVDEHSKSSRMAVVFAGMDSRQNVVIFDCYAGRDTTDKIIDRIFSMYQKWKPRAFGIESVVFSKLYIYIFQKEMLRRGKFLSIVPIKVSSTRSKEARIRDAIQSVAPLGKLFIFPNLHGFVEEFIEFPQSKYKDIMDATAHCINMLRPPMDSEEIKEIEEEEEYIINSRNKITGY